MMKTALSRGVNHKHRVYLVKLPAKLRVYRLKGSLINR